MQLRNFTVGVALGAFITTASTFAATEKKDVAAIEQKSYAFPWSENIFRDCLRVGYTCRALDLAGHIIGYAVMGVILAIWR